MKSEHILFERRGGVGLVTLNRPQALNALSHAMTRDLHSILRDWELDSNIAIVVVRGSGDKAFCAGGDITALYKARGTSPKHSHQFYWDEYRLNTYIKHYSKPYVSLIDGIVMGGGVGVSVHGSHRVVTQNVIFAMPETGIGLFPDVGATYFLTRCPGETGKYIGLTGVRLGAGDSLYAGVATNYTVAEKIDDLLDSLIAHPLQLEKILAEYSGIAQEGCLEGLRREIDKVFGASSLDAIFATLENDTSPWASNTLEMLRGKSPTSLKVSFRQLQEGRSLSFHQCMALEYRLVHRFISGKDFYEGIRAAVIDKDGCPVWNPRLLEAVDDLEVEKYFSPLGGEELSLEGLGNK